MRSLFATGALFMACAAPGATTGERSCSGFEDARGPFATPARLATLQPAAVQFYPDRDVIMKGQVPHVDIDIEERRFGRYNTTTAFTLVKPDGTNSAGSCDPLRAPSSSSRFAALSFECHRFDQAGVYRIEFDPASAGLHGEAAQLRLRVLDTPPPARAAPTGWKPISLAGAPPMSPCWNAPGYRVSLHGDRLELSVVDRGRSPAKLPVPLTSRISSAHASVVEYVFEADDGWVVMFDHGEFGGGIEWFPRAGGPPRSVFIGTRHPERSAVQNVNRAIALGEAIYVLQGISHLSISEGQLARLWREHDHFTHHVIARFASEPVDWIRLEDGSWLIATQTDIWQLDERGTADLVARLPNIAWYANSIVAEGDGTLYVGMSGGVLRLTPKWPDTPRYAVDLLLPDTNAGRSCWEREPTEE